MKTFNFYGRLLTGAALGLLSGLAFEGQAQATSTCSVDTAVVPNTFDCVDSTAPGYSASGTFSAGSIFSPTTTSPLQISSDGALDVVLNGDLRLTDDTMAYFSSLVSLTSSGPITYQSNGTTSGTTNGWMRNTYLRSDQSITASTGTVEATGLRVTGVFSETPGGDIVLTGGSTTVSGYNSYGLFAHAFTGNSTVNTGTVTASDYGSRGVTAMALQWSGCSVSPGNGSTTVNVTGDVLAEYVGIVALACDTATVNVEAGNTVAVTGNYGMAVLNSAMLASDTNIHGTLLAASRADRALVVRSHDSSSTLISSSGAMFGTFTGDYGNDAIHLTAGGTWESEGVSDFGDNIDNVQNHGTINVVSATFANLETFTNAGLLAISGGSFELSGSTSFVNEGTIGVAPGNTSITSPSPLTNNGTIDLQNGYAGDVLTITNDYVAGQSAQLLIDVSESQSDLLVVNGSSTGTTQLFVNAPAAIMSEGILVATSDSAMPGIMSLAAASSSGHDFVLGNGQASRLINLQLSQVGANLYLFAVPNETAFQPLALASVEHDLWHRSADVTSASALANGVRDGSQRFKVWGQFFSASNRFGSFNVANAFGLGGEVRGRINGERRGGQFGFDVVPVGNSLRLGLTAGYQNMSTRGDSVGGDIKAHAISLGAYAGFGHESGPYGALLIKHDWNDVELTNNAFEGASNDPDATSDGIATRLGVRWNSSPMTFDVGGGLSYVRTRIKDFSAEGIEYDFGRSDSIRGELRAKIGLSGGLAPFVDGSLYHEFGGKNRLSMVSGAVTENLHATASETWARVSAGIAPPQLQGLAIAGWLEAGDRKGFGLTGGVRF